MTRGVGAYDAGRVMNRQTARSQVIGGFTWGIGNALMEHTVLDRRTARVVNPNLSTYLHAVNADVPDIQAIFVDKPDPVSTALGARGFGETPITGVPAAIGNAIFHATGRRIRDLPFTQDKLLQGSCLDQALWTVSGGRQTVCRASQRLTAEADPATATEQGTVVGPTYTPASLSLRNRSTKSWWSWRARAP